VIYLAESGIDIGLPLIWILKLGPLPYVSLVLLPPPPLMCKMMI